MKRSYVLLLDAHGLTAYRCQKGEATIDARFPAGNTSSFATYLGDHADHPFFIAADVPDESFELEYIPHAVGRGRRALIERKRARHCHGSPLCAAIPQGRQSEGRRDDRLLFASLTRPQAIEPWLQAMQQTGAALEGVYSIPQLVADLAADRPEEQILLTTLTHNGLRQTFVAAGHLRFSRLTALNESALDEAAAACAEEAAHMRRYLCAHRLAERDAPLLVLVLAHPGQIPSFRRQCSDSDELRFDYLDLAAAAARYGMSTPPSDSHADGLLVHMLVRRRPRQQFAAHSVRRYARLQEMRRAIEGVGLATLVAGSVFGAVQLPEILRMRESAAQLQAGNSIQEVFRQEGRREEPSLARPAAELRDLEQSYAAMARTTLGPKPLLELVSRALDDLTAVELERIEWRLADEFDQTKGAFAILDLHGRLATGAALPERRTSVARLEQRLRDDPALRVAVLKQPFAMDSGRVLRSADDAEDGGQFAVRVAQPL
jgi:hypothetical protein